MLFVWALKGRRREKMKKCGCLDDDVVYEVSGAKESRVCAAPPKKQEGELSYLSLLGAA